MKARLFSLPFLALLFVNPAPAAVMVEWNFAGFNANDRPIDATFGRSGIDGTATSIDTGPGLGGVGGINNGFAVQSVTEASLANALTNDKFFGFTVTLEEGFAIKYDEISFEGLGNQTGGATPLVYSVFSSLTGFNLGDEIDSFNVDQSSGSQSATILLDEPEFLSTSQDVEFRFYIHDPSDVFGNFNWTGFRFNAADNIEIEVFGDFTEQIPEPSSVALLGLAALFLRRRMRRSLR